MKYSLALLLLLVIGCTQVDPEPAINTIWFKYTAPGDDGIIGQATITEFRMALSPDILQSDWETCILAGSCSTILEHTPWGPMIKDSISVDVFVEIGVEYFFAAKVVDDTGNWSLISNIVSLTFPDTFSPSPITDLTVRYAE